MIVKNPNQYTLQSFQLSETKGKKYDAILMNKKTNKIKRVPFGDIRYQQYKDATPLKLYKHLDTDDKQRRRIYRFRHAGEDKNKFSSGYFALKYLW